MASYVSTDHVYAKPLPPASYPVSQPLSKIDLIRLQHEAVKQSVEASAYPRELAPPTGYVDTVQYPAQGEWLASGLPEARSLISSSYTTQPTSDPYSLATSEGLMSSSSLQQDHLLNQQMLSGLEISGGPSTFSSGSSYQSGNSDYATTKPTTTASAAAATSSTAPPTTSATPTLITTSSSVGVVSGAEGVSSSGSSVVINTSTPGELQAEIERLKQQVREHELTIKQQSAQLQFTGQVVGGMATGGGGGVVHPAPVTPAPQYAAAHQVYGNGVGVVIGGEEGSRVPTAAVAPVAATPPIQYSSKQIQAAAAMAAALVNSQPNTAQYYPSTVPPLPSASAPPPGPTNTYPQPAHRWSGPQPGTGPPTTNNYIVSAAAAAAAAAQHYRPTQLVSPLE